MSKAAKGPPVGVALSTASCYPESTATAMDALGVQELELCPWALREGVILRRLDGLGGT